MDQQDGDAPATENSNAEAVALDGTSEEEALPDVADEQARTGEPEGGEPAASDGANEQAPATDVGAGSPESESADPSSDGTVEGLQRPVAQGPQALQSALQRARWALLEPRRRRWLLTGGVAASLLLTLGLWLLEPATIRIESDPPDAVLYLDGVQAGRTPMFLTVRGGGTWQVRIETPGHAPWTGTAQAAPRSVGRLLATLEPLPGALTIESDPPGATLELDGKELGATPVHVADARAGLHRISLSAPNHFDWIGEVRVPPGGGITHRIALRGFPAHVLFTAPVEGASLWIDGHHHGFLPLQLEMEAGERQIRLEAEGYRPWEKLVRFLPDEQRTFEILLQRPWPGVESDDPVYPLAVIIENQDLARPQTGLDRADVVYEALAEGGITRFLAVYATQDADTVGPVRSARHYFVNWAREHSAPLVHIGSSPQGYAALAGSGLWTLEETYERGAFWRSPARRAPHNAYTNTLRAREILSRRPVQPGSLGGLQFKNGDNGRLAGGAASEASIRYGPWAYGVGWAYDADWNEYVRWMNGAPHVDAVTDEPIRAANVLVVWVDSWPMDGQGRLDFAQVGQGRLIALVDGVAIEGTWAKRSLDAVTEYLGSDGQPIPLNAGPTWIQVLPQSGVLQVH